jgi:hypothetical protein
MFTPESARRREVVDAGEVLEGLRWDLRLRDAELVLKLACGGDLDAAVGVLVLLGVKVVERVRAARVRPHVRERDLLRRALLEEQAAVGRAEDKGGEGAVEEALVDVLHQVACAA